MQELIAVLILALLSDAIGWLMSLRNLDIACMYSL
jgi:hypothetical protein